MARPRNSDARDTRREIVDAALELFSKEGFHGTSMRDIARAVGVRESALYHHFPNKDALLEEVLGLTGLEAREEIDARLFTMLEAPIPVAPLLEKFLIGMSERMLTHRNSKLFRLLLSDGLRLAAGGKVHFWDRIGVGRNVLVEVMRRLMDQGRLRRGDPELFAQTLMNGMFMWRILSFVEPDHPWVKDRPAYIRQHVEQFLRGAAPEKP